MVSRCFVPTYASGIATHPPRKAPVLPGRGKEPLMLSVGLAYSRYLEQEA